MNAAVHAEVIGASVKNVVYRVGLNALYATGLHRVMQPFVGGVGACFMLHHVRPAQSREFDPNGHLEITPEFLDATLTRVKALGLDIVSLDEAARRLRDQDFARRFAVFTLDDGYRDNVEHAWPVFARHQAPFTVYVATGLVDRASFMWWRTLEDIIGRNSQIRLPLESGEVIVDVRSLDAKAAAYGRLTAEIHAMGEDEAIAFTADLARAHGVDAMEITDRELANWIELDQMAGDPLCTIGAHTVSHPMLARLSAERARWEIEESATRLEARLGRKMAHFAYPYGYRMAASGREFDMARELGFVTAVTTRPGVIFPVHAGHMTALPRVSINGRFQLERFVDVLVSGAPFALFNRFRQLDVA